MPPGIFWNRLLVTETGEYPRVRKATYPVLCNHCKKAVCVDVCPTGASARREDGIVTIDAERLCGVPVLRARLPLSAAHILRGRQERILPRTRQDRNGSNRAEALSPGARHGREMQFLQGANRRGDKRGLKPGVDREATPACVITCMVKARHFGDLDDPESNVSMLVRERNGRPLRPELGTEPSVYYVE